MIDVRIDFSGAAPNFDFSTPVRDFDATVQNAMINTGTLLGSDRLYPTRGTNLLKDAAEGRMINAILAAHQANFAALRTLAFVQQHDVESNPSKLQDFQLQLLELQNQQVSLLISALSDSGEIRGESAQL